MSALVLTFAMVVVFLTGSPLSSVAQHPGVTTDSQSATTTGQGSDLSRTKTLSVESRTSALVTVPISPIIGEAWGELLREEKPPERTKCEGLWAAPFSARKAVQDENPLVLPCAFSLGYLYAFVPTMGWPVKPDSPAGTGYMLRTFVHVLYVNNLASDIAAQVAAQSYPSPAEAKDAIKVLLKARRSYLIQAYEDSFSLYLQPGSINLAQAKDVKFSHGTYHLTLGEGGAVLKYSGVDWFGNGNLSGKRYELQLASMTGVGMTKGKTLTDGAEQKTGVSDKAQAGVGK